MGDPHELFALAVIVEADGGSEPNPGPSAIGVVVSDAVTGMVLAQCGRAIGRATNNVAEYRALIAGLRLAASLDATEVTVRMDSQLVINQMRGLWAVNTDHLKPLRAEALDLCRHFDDVEFVWNRRIHNQAADALAGAALRGQPYWWVDPAAGPVPDPVSA